MFYGLFIVLPGTLLIFAVMLSWIGSSGARLAEAHGGRRWNPARFLGLLYIPLIARAYIPNAAICLAWRETNDPAEGDPPLLPFISSLDGILLWSALICLPFALYHLGKSVKAQRAKSGEEAPANV